MLKFTHAAAALFVALAAISPSLAAEPRVIALGELPLLFVDDSGVESKTGLARTVHQAKTHAAPVVEPDRPWEGQRVYVYGSMYPDPTGGYRLWYMAAEKLNGGVRAMYATSNDGLKWTKPNLGLYEFDGNTSNNILLDLNNPNVIIDAFEKDPSKRYKMIGIQKPGITYRTFYSANGKNWTPSPHQPSFKSPGDTLTLTQDPATGEYLLYHKQDVTIRGKKRRTVFLSRSPDFQTWSKGKQVLAADEQDDSWVVGDVQNTQIYDMSVFPHAAGFVGLPTMFRVIMSGERSPGRSGHDGPLDIQLATSADGEHWERSWPRVNIIPRGSPGTFDGGGILGMSNTATHTPTETWVFYTAMTTGHGGPVGVKRLSIGRADWRRHGFASLDADPQGGRLETKPLKLEGPDLIVNSDASRGELRVGLLEADGKPIPGYSMGESDVLKSDAMAWMARWKNQRTVPTDRSVKVVIEMKSGRLFSLGSGKPE